MRVSGAPTNTSTDIASPEANHSVAEAKISGSPALPNRARPTNTKIASAPHHRPR